MELVGHIGRDGEFKYTPEGTGILRFSIAVNQGYKDKKHTEWVKVTIFGKQAETLSTMLTQGALVLVCADDWKVEKWKSKTGEPGACLALTARTVRILHSNKAESEDKKDVQ